MPEIKHQFTGGKMNKDVDERLVPNGEYRDAMNIQVSSSEGSDVGTIQNILGNSAVVSDLGIDPNSKCVGSIADEKNDALYWFVREPLSQYNTTIAQSRDIIFELKSSNVKHVFVDKKQLSIAVNTLQAPASGNIVINSQMGFDAINVNDTFQLWQNGVNISGSDSYEVLSKDYSGNFHINIGDYTNASWSGVQVQGPGELQIVVTGGGGVLKFPESIITGINIIDDMLFWTDGVTEPKKINIPRSIIGSPSGNTHTKLINPAQGISYGSNIDVEEKHLTVIKKAPKSTLAVKTETIPEFGTGTDSGVIGMNFLQDTSNPVLGNLSVGGIIDTQGIGGLAISSDPGTPMPVVGDILLFNPQGNSTLPPAEFEVKVRLNSLINDGSSDFIIGAVVLLTAGTYQFWDAEIVSIAGYTSTTAQQWNWSIEFPEITTFKNKFPRFSYRWQYQDGEYSTFAPFTNPVFQPAEEFKYDIKEAYNIAMENVISQARLKGYANNLPEDVKSIDILYKESDSPNVYIVDTLSGGQAKTSNSTFEVTPNQLKAVLPSNQLLRAWDNVPRKALAQEVSGSRVIYGNYLQNYDLEDNIVFNTKIVNRSVCDAKSDKKSLKSIRNYSLGVSYLDKYGRQSPIFTHKKGNIDIPVRKAQETNQLQAEIITDKPSWATHCKFFIKDVSNEYYNLAMDRVYDARDGNIWLSFPSSDRNKVDKESFLILKKGVEGAQPVKESNRYKILAIENEAPTFIKTKQWIVAEIQEDPTTATFDYFTDINGYPIESSKSIIINKTAWDGLNIPLSDIESMSVKFTREVVGQTQVTGLYDVAEFFEETTSAMEYRLTLAKPIKETWLNDPSNTAQPDPTIGIVIYKKNIEDSPEFDGRFFVKVAKDIIIDQYIVSQAAISITNQVSITTQIPFYYLADQSNPTTPSDTTSSIVGGISDTAADWTALFNPEGVGVDSMWFIDAAHYVGYYKNDGTLQHQGMLGADNFAKTGPYPNNPSELNIDGYNKGIYEENGQAYIDLSFGYVKAADGTGSTSTYGYAMHSDGTDTANVQLALDSFVNQYVPNHPSYGNAYFQEMKDGFSHGDGFGGSITQGSNNNDLIKHWKVGSALNANHNQTQNQEIVSRLQQNQQFQFAGDDTLYTITDTPEITYHLNYKDLREYYSEFNTFMTNMFAIYYPDYNGGDTSYTFGMNTGYVAAGAFQQLELVFNEMKQASVALNKRVTWKIPISANPTASGSTFNPINPNTGADATNIGTIQFVDIEWSSVDDQVVAEDPAIWETEPKKDVDIDIYYEVDSTFPLEINDETNYSFAPIGSVVSHVNPTGVVVPTGTKVVSWDGNILEVDVELNDMWMNQSNGNVTFHRPDGSCVTAGLMYLVDFYDDGGGNNASFKVEIDPDVSKKEVNLSWFNCYSFGNGVESQRIRDDFNQIKIDKGVKASATLDEPYKEEHRKYGLIYSGLYNSTSGVNNLNQFIAAEKITKDLNPVYGSIQKLHSRSTADGDLIALCEDRVLKILANKDAVYNADGNPQLTATDRVLGQAMPFGGEFGISKNPESFASESYRVYFTDKVRGAVMRLSKDGLTAISDHGMKDWFRDNLKLSNRLIGSYDDKKDEYNITLIDREVNNVAEPKTVSFREDVRGWVSFKSFTPENAISCANEYYSVVNGRLWLHHVEQVDNFGVEFGRNTFYNLPHNSTFNVILNDIPGSVKSFNTINYEGSQSKVKEFTTDPTTNLSDGGYYNLSTKKGWHVDSISTNKESGTINEFIEKEGKWFSYIKGRDIQHSGGRVKIERDGSSTFDQASFAVQGLGILSYNPSQVNINGCTDPTQSNYDSNATIDDGSCIPFTYGCTNSTASNYNSTVNTDDDGSCVWFGCTDSTAMNPTLFPPTAWSYGSGGTGSAIVDDGSCIALVYGCSDVTACCGTYNPLANGIDPSDPYPCVYTINGCSLPSADNYDATANTDIGNCTWAGCTEPLATNYIGFPGIASTYSVSSNMFGIQDDGSCLGGGCTDAAADNYDPTATYDPVNGNGSCFYCDWTIGGGAYNGIPITVTTLNASVGQQNNGQIAVERNIYGPYGPTLTYVLVNDNGNVITTYVTGQTLGGFTDSNSILFSGLATGTYSVTIQGSGTASVCTYSVPGVVIDVDVIPVQFGCMEASACNYDATATQQQSGDCNYTTCAGCIASTASNNQLQTNSAADCLMPGTFTPGPCTIGCGDGNNANYQGTYCCDYTVYGCTDPLACNYYTPPNSNYTVIPTDCYYDGCMDSTASNYMPCATNQPAFDANGNPTCQYTSLGCTDANACNYNSAANNDDGSCVDGFVGYTIGDPNTVNIQNQPVSVPVYYHAGSVSNILSTDTITHFLSPTNNSYPVDSVYENDLGLSIQSANLNMAQYGSSGNVKVRLSKRDFGSGISFTLVEELLISANQVYWMFDPSGPTFGHRNGAGSLPHTWNGYVFDVRNQSTTSSTLQQYKIEITSVINGVEYGNASGPTPSCGIYDIFTFNPQTTCSNPHATSGCADPLACNYDNTADCNDGSCYYGTQSPSYEPILPCGNGCQVCGSCGGTPCDPSTVNYSSLSACNAACGPN